VSTPRAHVLPLLAIFAARTALAALGVALILGRAGDVSFYYALAAESARGRLPYVQFWVEYPPLFPWLAVALYALAGALAGPQRQQAFTILLSAVNLAAEYLNLFLLYALAVRLHGRRQALKSALLYALLLPPVVFALLGMIEPLAECFLLLGLLLALRRQPAASGLALGLGVLAKLYPLAALPALAMLLAPALRWRLLAACAVVVGAVGLLCLLVSPAALLGSVAASSLRPPWETPWAVLEGCCPVGQLTPPAARGLAPDPSTAFHGRIPWPLVTLAFAAAYLLVLRARRGVPPRAPLAARDAVLLTLFTLALLLLWSRGFSPQFVEWLLPLLLLAFPQRAGPRLALGYTVLTFVEYAPIAPGSPLLEPLFLALVGMRTLLTLVVAILAACAWIRPAALPSATAAAPALPPEPLPRGGS